MQTWLITVVRKQWIHFIIICSPGPDGCVISSGDDQFKRRRKRQIFDDDDSDSWGEWGKLYQNTIMTGRVTNSRISYLKLYTQIYKYTYTYTPTLIHIYRRHWL